jgi:ribosomal protein S18 acetylase RimI-like enzyme/DNA-binding MarR family transcriptional regulator
MEYLTGLGLLAMGSRMRALSDRFYDMADEMYRREGIELQSRWMPVLRLLHDRGPRTVGEIADAIGQTHSAVSQLAKKLAHGGWLHPVATSDKRQRRLDVTAKAVAALQQTKPLWHALREELEARCEAAGVDPLATFAALGAIPGPEMAEAVLERSRALKADQVEIVPFAPEFRGHFHRLNVEWLQRYFHVEEIDERVLSNPETEILAGGGAIWFARVGGGIVGTCALMQVEPGVFELTKMAVDPNAQGLGIGRKLIERAIAEFQLLGARELFLETNTKLAPAIRLYESVGFEHQPSVRPGTHYSRANVYMIWRGGGVALPAHNPGGLR